MQKKTETIHLKLVTLADYASLTSDNKINIMGAMSELSSETVPFMVPRFYLAMVLRGVEADWGRTFISRFELKDPKSNLLMEGGGPQTFTPHTNISGLLPNFNLILEFGGMPFQHFGHHVFRMWADENVVVEYGFRVQKIKFFNPSQGATP